MQATILDVSGHKAQPLAIDAAISFETFISYLKQRISEEPTVKARLYKEALAEFEASDVGRRDIPLEEITQYTSLLEYVYACLSPATRPEQQLVWGLSYPFLPVTFYGTDLIYELLGNKSASHTYEITHTPADYHRERLALIYSLILQRLYNFKAPVKTEQYHEGVNTATGLLQYYEVSINTDFIKVTAKGELPEIDFVQLYTHFSEGGGEEILADMLPLDLFCFRGFCVINVMEVTAQKAVENITGMRLSRTSLILSLIHI